MCAYRSAVHESTGFSPNMLFYGRELLAPIDLVTQQPPDKQTVDDFVDQVEWNTKYAHQLAREQLRAQSARRKKYYDMRVRETTFQKHDWVYYFYPRRRVGKSPKWQRLYIGPFLVTERLGPVNYVIQRSAKADPLIVHIDKLKAYEGDPPVNWLIPRLGTQCEEREQGTEILAVDIVPAEGSLSHDNEQTRPKRTRRQPTRLHDYVQ